MPNKNQLHATVVQRTNSQKQSMISLSVTVSVHLKYK